MTTHFEVTADLAGPDEMRQEAVVLPLMADLGGDDGGMNLDRLRETDDRHRRGIPARFACLPDRQRDEGFVRPLIGLGLLRLPTATFDFAERQVVDKGDVTVTLHVTAEMGELMQEAEPEAVDAIVPKRQAHHWRAITQLQRRPVEVGSRQVTDDHQRDAMLAEEPWRALAPRPTSSAAQPGRGSQG